MSAVNADCLATTYFESADTGAVLGNHVLFIPSPASILKKVFTRILRGIHAG
jgi:hypothetical protein